MKLLGFWEGKAYIIDAPDNEVKKYPHVRVTKDMTDWADRQSSKEEDDGNRDV